MSAKRMPPKTDALIACWSAAAAEMGAAEMGAAEMGAAEMGDRVL